MTKQRDTQEGGTDKMSRSGNSARDLNEAKERKAGSRAEDLTWLRASATWKPQGGNKKISAMAKGTGSHRSTHASLEPTKSLEAD